MLAWIQVWPSPSLPLLQPLRRNAARDLIVPVRTLPEGLAFDGTYIWAADSSTDTIYKMLPNELCCSEAQSCNAGVCQ